MSKVKCCIIYVNYMHHFLVLRCRALAPYLKKMLMALYPISIMRKMGITSRTGNSPFHLLSRKNLWLNLQKIFSQKVLFDYALQMEDSLERRIEFRLNSNETSTKFITRHMQRFATPLWDPNLFKAVPNKRNMKMLLKLTRLLPRRNASWHPSLLFSLPKYAHRRVDPFMPLVQCPMLEKRISLLLFQKYKMNVIRLRTSCMIWKGKIDFIFLLITSSSNIL